MDATNLMTILLVYFLFVRLLLKLHDCLSSFPPDPIGIPTTHDHRQEATDNHQKEEEEDEEERLQQQEMRITQEGEDEEERFPLREIRITDNQEGEEEQQEENKNIREYCTECAICFEVFTDDDDDDDDDDELKYNEQNTTEVSVWVLKECGHKFHKSCLAPWLRICRFNATCPNCRCPVNLQDLITTPPSTTMVPRSFPTLTREIVGRIMMRRVPISTEQSIPNPMPLHHEIVFRAMDPAETVVRRVPLPQLGLSTPLPQ